MCFSAQASFGASILLLAMGYASFKNIKSKKLWPIAAVPLMFAAPQFFEGLVWLSNTGYIAEAVGSFAKYGFLFFAFAVWPFWIPFACWHTEENPKRKQMIVAPFVLGIVISTLLLALIFSLGINAEVNSCHIVYTFKEDMAWSDSWGNLILLLYSIAVLAPFLISTRKNMPLLGLTIAASLVIAYIFFYQFLISVWCFFAAIVSALIYLVVTR